jgi:hypothetical protein
MRRQEFGENRSIGKGAELAAGNTLGDQRCSRIRHHDPESEILRPELGGFGYIRLDDGHTAGGLPAMEAAGAEEARSCS